MDEVERLIQVFRARAAATVTSKLDGLVDLERLRDPRIVPFLLHVLADRSEPAEVRIHVLKWLRNGSLQPADRESVAAAFLQIVADHSSSDLRVQAALALAGFTEIERVSSTLGGLALSSDDPIDLRYAAFTSLQGAGPTPESLAVLRELAGDDALGPSARSLLSAWRSRRQPDA